MTTDTTTPSAARHEHCWMTEVFRYRVSMVSGEWTLDRETACRPGSWERQSHSTAYAAAAEIARLAGLVPPEER